MATPPPTQLEDRGGEAGLGDYDLLQVFGFLEARDLCRTAQALLTRDSARLNRGPASQQVFECGSWKRCYRSWYDLYVPKPTAKTRVVNTETRGPLPLLVSAVATAVALAWGATPTLAAGCAIATLPLAWLGIFCFGRGHFITWLSVFTSAFASVRIVFCCCCSVFPCHARELQTLLLSTFLSRSGYRADVARRNIFRHLLLLVMPYGASSLAVQCGFAVLFALCKGRLDQRALFLLAACAWCAPLIPALLWVGFGWHPSPFPPLLPWLFGPKLAFLIALLDIFLFSKGAYQLLFRSGLFLRFFFGQQRY